MINAHSKASLFNLKSKGGLTYSNDFIFGLPSSVEKSFAKHCKNNNVFLLTIDEFFETNKFINFPCIKRKQDVLISYQTLLLCG